MVSLEETHQFREKCNYLIELGEKLNRLEQNRDFQALFLQYYLKELSVQLVHSIAKTPIEDLKDKMVGIAQFTAFMEQVKQQAQQAKIDLQELINMQKEQEL